MEPLLAWFLHAVVGASLVAPPAPAGRAIARLELDAAVRCAPRADLVARVAARSARIRLTDDPNDRPVLHAKVTALAAAGTGGVSIELTVDAGGGKSAARRLTAGTCEQAVDALAVMIVVLLDPAALASAPPSARPPPPLGPRPPPAASALAAPKPMVTPPSTTSAAAAPAVREPQALGARRSPDDETPRPSANWHFGAGAAGHRISGPAPAVMPGVALDLHAGLDRHAILSPSARLLLAHDGRSGFQAVGGRASFTLDSVELDLCPFALAAGRVALKGCAAGIAGRLRARGSDTFEPEAHAQFFAALGGAALVSVRLAAHLEVQAGLAAGPSAGRDAFAFSPLVFYRVAAITGAATVGLGMTLP